MFRHFSTEGQVCVWYGTLSRTLGTVCLKCNQRLDASNHGLWKDVSSKQQHSGKCFHIHTYNRCPDGAPLQDCHQAPAELHQVSLSNCYNGVDHSACERRCGKRWRRVCSKQQHYALRRMARRRGGLHHYIPWPQKVCVDAAMLDHCG